MEPNKKDELRKLYADYIRSIQLDYRIDENFIFGGENANYEDYSDYSDYSDD